MPANITTRSLIKSANWLIKCFIYLSHFMALGGENALKKKKKKESNKCCPFFLIRNISVYQLKTLDCHCAVLSAGFANPFSDTTQSVTTDSQTIWPSVFLGRNSNESAFLLSREDWRLKHIPGWNRWTSEGVFDQKVRLTGLWRRRRWDGRASNKKTLIKL